jgi:lipopolysaccharide transport system permease protein
MLSISAKITHDQTQHRMAAPRRLRVIGPPSLLPSGLVSNFTTLGQYSDLLYTLSVFRIKVRYKQSVLGMSWAIFQPLSLMLAYTLIFSLLAKMPSDGRPYAVFAYCALLPWTYFSTALTGATHALVSYTNLITKVYFPRELLPLSYVIAALFDFTIASSILGGLLIHYRVAQSASTLYVVPIILVLTIFAVAMAFFFSALQVRFRDVGFAIQLLLQLWMFATPVVYPLSSVPANLRRLYILNPMVGIVENFRRALLHNAPLDLRSLGVAAAASILLVFASYLYFKRMEATMADII